MKHLLSLLIFALVGTTGLYAQCFEKTCMPRNIQESCTVDKSKGCIDWTNGIIYAVGLGVPNPDFKIKSQRVYGAIRAGKTVAMRNLLEVVEGVNIDSKTTVKAGMLQNDDINTHIKGKIKNVESAGQRTMADGSVWVTVKMYTRDIMEVLTSNERPDNNADTWHSAPSSQPGASDSFQQPQTATPPVKDSPYGGSADAVYTGLIIDARGTGVEPALSPKIFDPSGKEIYGSLAVDREFALKHGVAAYVKTIDDAKQDDRVKGTALVIKSTGLYGNQSSDLKISDQDAILLSNLDRSQSFLREARVMVVID